MRAESHRHVVRDHLNDSTDRVPRALGLVHGCLETLVVGGIESAHRRLAQRLLVQRSWQDAGRCALRADSNHVRDEADRANLSEERLCKHTERDASRGLAGARALQDGPGLREVVGQHTGKVRVSGSRPSERAITCDLAFISGARVNEQIAWIHGVGAHHGLPLGPLRVADTNRDRRPGRDTVAHPRQDRRLVGFELLACAAPVAEAPTCQPRS